MDYGAAASERAKNATPGGVGSGASEIFQNIQVLRAVAALLVVIGHLQPLFERIDPRLGFVGLGRAGVDLFFVISGFVMVHTTKRADPSPALFTYRRITRIVPLYWLLTLTVFVLALVAPSLLGASRPDPVWFAKSLGFIPFAKGDGTMNPLLPVGWSLNYEMAFYGVFALSMFGGQRWRYWIAGALMLAAALPGFLRMPISDPVVNWYTRPVVAEFVAGMVIGGLFPRLSGISRPWAAVAATGVCALFAVLLGSGLTAIEPLRTAIASAAAAGILVLAITLERGGWAVTWQPALLVGNASYSIYLTHLFMTQVAVTAAIKLGVAGAAAAAGSVAAAAIAIVAGVIAYRLFELPATRALKAFPTKLLSAMTGHVSGRRLLAEFDQPTHLSNSATRKAR